MVSLLVFEVIFMVIFDWSKFMVLFFLLVVSVVFLKFYKLVVNIVIFLFIYWCWIWDEICYKDNVIFSLRKFGFVFYFNWGFCWVSMCYIFIVVVEYKLIKCCDYMISVCIIFDFRMDYKFLDVVFMVSWRMKYYYFYVV